MVTPVLWLICYNNSEVKSIPNWLSSKMVNWNNRSMIYTPPNLLAVLITNTDHRFRKRHVSKLCASTHTHLYWTIAKSINNWDYPISAKLNPHQLNVRLLLRVGRQCMCKESFRNFRNRKDTLVFLNKKKLSILDDVKIINHETVVSLVWAVVEN